MQSFEVVLKSGRSVFKLQTNSTELSDMIDEGCNGFCVSCGTYHEGDIDPDARKQVCEECTKPSVYGIEELVLMNMIELEDE